MYKIILVEDEEIMRVGMRDFIDWKSMGFEPVEVFEDGKEAIAYLEKHDVDVVLTDIKMAEVSGIELAKYVHERKPGTKTQS